MPNDKLHIVGNLFIENGSPEITFETGSSHYNWQIAAQENVNAALEFSVGSQDADASNDTFTPKNDYFTKWKRRYWYNISCI